MFANDLASDSTFTTINLNDATDAREMAETGSGETAAEGADEDVVFQSHWCSSLACFGFCIQMREDWAMWCGSLPLFKLSPTRSFMQETVGKDASTGEKQFWDNCCILWFVGVGSWLLTEVVVRIMVFVALLLGFLLLVPLAVVLVLVLLLIFLVCLVIFCCCCLPVLLCVGIFGRR